MRILLFLSVILAGIYFAPQSPQISKVLDQQPVLKKIITTSSGKVKGVADSIDLSSALTLLEEKNIISPEFVKNISSSQSSQVLDTQKFTEDITNQIKDMPKNEAKKIIQSTCQQLIKNLE